MVEEGIEDEEERNQDDGAVDNGKKIAKKRKNCMENDGKKAKKVKENFQDKFLEMQERQMNAFAESDQRNREFLVELEEQQRKAAAEEIVLLSLLVLLSSLFNRHLQHDFKIPNALSTTALAEERVLL